MNGAILPGTNIAVDFWKIRNLPYTSLTFFLTHLHGDHIAGLTSSWAFPIYCTEITASLLEKRHGLDPSILRPLELNESHIITRKETKKTYTVTVIDANHCPGAAMFLFQGDFGTILHTGDLRYNTSMLEPTSPLSSHIANIDVVYLDNTFCSPKCIFPSREIVREQILSIINNHPEHDVVLGVRKLGKEDLLVWLAQELQEWISVSGPMLEVAELLNMPRVFKIQDTSCRIRTVPFQMVCKRNMVKWNSTHPTIAILPTSIYTGIGGQPFVNQDDVFVVPYSDHSSFSELEEFISRLRPASIVPIVSADSKGPFNVCLRSRADMSVFDQYCVAGNKRLRVCSDDNQLSWKSSLIENSQKRKSTLRKQRSNPVLRKPVLKGVHFDSPDKDSFRKSQTTNSLSPEESNGCSSQPSQNNNCVIIRDIDMLWEQESMKNQSAENDEVFGSQGFVPRVLLNYEQRDKENRKEDLSESSLSMQNNSEEYVHLMNSSSDSCVGMEVTSPKKKSVDKSKFDIGTSKSATMTSKEPDVNCADVSEVGGSNRRDGSPSQSVQRKSQARTPADVTKNCSFDSPRSQARSDYSSPAMDDPTCNIAYENNTKEKNQKDLDFIKKHSPILKHSVTTRNHSTVSSGSSSSSEHPLALENSQIQNEHFRNHSAATVKNSLPNDGLNSSCGSPIVLEHSESLKRHLKSNRNPEKTHCQSSANIQLPDEETQTNNEEIQTEDEEPDCLSEAILSPNEETQCPIEIKSLLEDSSEEDIFAWDQKEHSVETAQSLSGKLELTNDEHLLEHQKSVDSKGKSFSGSKQPEEMKKSFNDEESSDNENSSDETVLGPQTNKGELYKIEDGFRHKNSLEKRLTRIKDKQFNPLSSEKKKLSKMNRSSGSMVISQSANVSHIKEFKRNSRSENFQVRAKSVECLRVKPLKTDSSLSLNDKKRTKLHHIQSEVDISDSKADKVVEHNEQNHKSCVTNLEKHFAKSLYTEENSKYFPQPEPVIDLTEQPIQGQSKINSFLKLMKKKAIDIEQTSATSISDSGLALKKKPKASSRQQPSIQKGTKRKYTTSVCDFCGCDEDVSCSCSSLNCFKRRCIVSERYFAKCPIWFSVKPLSPLSDLERRKTSQRDTIASLHSWLERHK